MANINNSDERILFSPTRRPPREAMTHRPARRARPTGVVPGEAIDAALLDARACAPARYRAECASVFPRTPTPPYVS